MLPTLRRTDRTAILSYRTDVLTYGKDVLRERTARVRERTVGKGFLADTEQL